MSDDEVRRALAGLVPAGDLAAPESGRERWARARWSVLAEPGDGIAGLAIQRLGPSRALQCALRDDTPPAELDLDVRDWRRACARWRPRQDDHRYPIERARRVGVRLVIPGDAAWPVRVDELGIHAPVALWARGQTDVLAAPVTAVALVGARAATPYGVQVAGEIAGDLGVGGATIVSGAAVGIDAAAHRACLAVDGVTIAVLAGGVDKAYPSGHAGLLTDVSRRGVVVSEVPCGTAPTKWRFLQRNRLIAALSDATVVVEAGWRSGSLNTAGHAAALGRALGAVPGPVTSAASAGCHRILREYDGRCITSADDVRELLGWSVEPGHAAALDGDGRTDDATRVLDALSTRAPRDVAEIARRSGVAGEDVSGWLGLLELDGRVVSDERGWRRTAS
ncbi:DNA-processing protein DprA [Microbacterium sp. Yaish 1]|uniref:DNA-processing protein DprA n=1 Tax=Microbacterium sp. Yaish 1 TaxID=2025014 RepID=UPI000B9421A2|nr:DNA-processing protein DprA [Microbacterium sp. Yaish 1]OYC95289.1 DNA-protecting protein DprA [Microbacterium sp. Yaish 1]